MKLCEECTTGPVREPGGRFCSRSCAGRAVSRTHGCAAGRKSRALGTARFWARLESACSGHGWQAGIRLAYVRGYHAGKIARYRRTA